MLYPSNIESKLGFDQIREMLRKECLSSLGLYYADRMKFSADYDFINKKVNQTAEFKNILDRELLYPSSNYMDALPYLRLAEPEGAFLDSEAFFNIRLSLKTIIRWLDFLEEKTEFPFLQALIINLSLDKKITKRIDEVIDDKGGVRDHASAALAEIRRDLSAKQTGIRKELDKILRHFKKEGFTAEDVSVTIRSGRMVVPVLAEHKRKIKGFVHDESATGQTVFIEPAQVLEINNELRELEYQEKREVVRILKELTDELRPVIPELRKAYYFLGKMDFIRAKARLAVHTESLAPKMSGERMLQWKEAKHPLLLISNKRQGKAVVPLSVTLDKDIRILVISGPNAGGKSVCLKTVGLLQYMYQCGMLVPAAETSAFCVFEDIFIDIGDEQSIENDLSTYSSHLSNMKYFLSHAGPGSLVLIDEFGTGTEPQFGGALAEAVLEELNKRNIFGVITTHYSNLKIFADSAEGMRNASMRFDPIRMEPLYEMETGKPGSSFALEIASRIGLPAQIIERTRAKLGAAVVDYDKLIADLEAEVSKYKKVNETISGKEAKVDQIMQEYAEMKNFLESNRKQLMNEARAKAKMLVQEANQKIENIIREIKETGAEKDRTKELRKELTGFKETLLPEMESSQEIIPEQVSGEIHEGDFVRLREQGAVAEVVSVKNQEAVILIGDLKSKVKLNRLEKISRKEYQKEFGSEGIRRSAGSMLSEKMADFSGRIDLRGKRGEEALGAVDEFMDKALMLGVYELQIVHGKGDGILRRIIRDHLKKHKEISSLADDHADRGGAGVTIVKLK